MQNFLKVPHSKFWCPCCAPAAEKFWTATDVDKCKVMHTGNNTQQYKHTVNCIRDLYWDAGGPGAWFILTGQSMTQFIGSLIVLGGDG